MLKMFPRIAFVILLVLLSAYPLWAEQGMAIDPATCLGCHGDKISAASFVVSVHGKNGCNSCHIQLTDLSRHVKGEIKMEKVRCERCHKKENAEHYASVHIQKDVQCADCHTDIHTHRYWKKDKRIVVAKCIQCHDHEAGYRQFIHGKKVAAGNQDSAACHDCHNLHDIKPMNDPKFHTDRVFHTKVCLRCHSNEEMMKRNSVFNVATTTYMESYHGKNYRLGYPEKVAGCSDCHTAHSVLKASDPLSTVHPDNLVATCKQCHKQATSMFTKFYAHGEHTDRKKYPLLYWTFILMVGLLVSTFSVFWVHTLLWMYRGFIENREKAALLTEGAIGHTPDGFKQYRRFNTRHIILHILVIVSFLGLALTGLPLKFSDQELSKFLMALYGGTANAALIHRICAVITFVYFLSANAMCIHFLFIRKDIPGNWMERMLGPDSLCPNPRDIRDITAMMRWFFFKGPKPTFERWSYWEKFDFLAVFWGMFAIGGSGLMLWFPEFFGFFLPGWMFNVATIVHSEEALLATGFIFTVHFFNTHFRPEKFPMDFVIFNGQISKHELIEERRDQWQRYEREGITGQIKVKKGSGVFFDFFFKGFGFLALFLGIALLFMMLYTFLAAPH
ncbi:MAG: cytochrome c3 family protein [Proteobacteria bacterium]|nr:cytochrome c3 family protein [Pseudomonadota bacterium]